MASLISITSSYFFYKSSNPIFTCLYLILFTGISSFLILSVKASWLFMATIIMFLGGMMVVFVYASSLSTKKKLFMKNNSFTVTMLMMISFFVLTDYSKNWFSVSIQLNPSMVYEDMSAVILIIMAFYLLLTLVILIKIIKWKEGPLKSKF